MPRILIAECKQEISSFNPVSSHHDDFVILEGPEILAYHQNLNTEVAGALAVFAKDPNISLLPTYSARAITSGGPLMDQSYTRIAQGFLEAVLDAPPVDAAYVCLHGAMASDSEPDPEGFLLAEMRQILGEDVPIVASFDLHGILTDRILRNTDAIFAFHTYPHVDFASTGARAAQLLRRMLSGPVSPVTAVVEIPALVRGSELITETGLFGRQIRQAQAIEQSPGGLSAGMFIGNPFTDVPDLRSYSFVVTDGDPERAKREALQMAEDFWDVRASLHQPLISLDEAVDRAIALHGKGTVILTDAADATSSGATGDSNAILGALMERNYPGRVLAPIVDSIAVSDAVGAGVGAKVRTTLGGRLDPDRFPLLRVVAKVRMISDGRCISESNGAVWNAGMSAVLEVGNHTVIATSRPISLYDRTLFWAHGQEPSRFDAVVVKSPHCQPHMFADWAVEVLNVDAPGSTSANLHSLGHTRCRRPVYPLDANFAYTPAAKIYQRQAEEEAE